MTVARRVASLEADADATERVVRWLDEAHAYGTFEAFVKASVAIGPAAMPLDRLSREALAGLARASDEERRATLRAILFRVHLVLGIIERTSAVAEREALVVAVLSAHLGLALADDRPEAASARLVELRDLLLERVAELHAQEAARQQAEARFLGGTTALFPAEGREWTAQVRSAEEAAVMAVGLVELDGGPDVDAEAQLAPHEDRIEACLRGLIEMARIKTLDDFDDGDAALSRIRRWIVDA